MSKEKWASCKSGQAKHSHHSVKCTKESTGCEWLYQDKDKYIPPSFPPGQFSLVRINSDINVFGICFCRDLEMFQLVACLERAWKRSTDRTYLLHLYALAILLKEDELELVSIPLGQKGGQAVVPQHF